MHTVKLTYQVNALTNNYSPIKLNYFGKKQKRIRHEVFLYSGGIDLFTYSENNQLLYRRHHDFRKNKAIELNEITKKYSEYSNNLKQDFNLENEYSIQLLDGKQRFVIDQQAFNTKRLILSNNEADITVSYASLGLEHKGRSRRLFLNSILGGLAGVMDLKGTPVKIVVSDNSEDSTGQYYLKLINYSRETEVPSPPDKTNHADRLQEAKHKLNKKELIERQYKKRAKEKKEINFNAQLNTHLRSLKTNRLALRSSGHDFNWCFNQSLLDLFKNVINPLLDGHTFYGDGAGEITLCIST